LGLGFFTTTGEAQQDMYYAETSRNRHFNGCDNAVRSAGIRAFSLDDAQRRRSPKVQVSPENACQDKCCSQHNRYRSDPEAVNLHSTQSQVKIGQLCRATTTPPANKNALEFLDSAGAPKDYHKREITSELNLPLAGIHSKFLSAA